jgi:hypothetical protein
VPVAIDIAVPVQAGGKAGPLEFTRVEVHIRVCNPTGQAVGDGHTTQESLAFLHHHVGYFGAVA